MCEEKEGFLKNINGENGRKRETERKKTREREKKRRREIKREKEKESMR